jgi:hypothetical protein
MSRYIAAAVDPVPIHHQIFRAAGVRVRKYAEKPGTRQNGAELILQDAEDDGLLPPLEASMDEAGGGDEVAEGANRVHLEKNIVEELGRESA